MNLPIITFLVIIAVTSSQFLDRLKAHGLLCTPCEGPDCDVTYESCKYGTFRNFCGRLECKRGLNQTCGGRFDIRGKCADEMMCTCNVCTGCTPDLKECYKLDCHMERNELSFNPTLAMNPGRPMRFPYATAIV